MSGKHSRATTLRRVVAGVFVFIGLFVIFFGIGYGQVSVTLAGLAMLLLSLSGRLVTSLRGTVRQWVTGSGEVIYVASPPPAASYGRCELEMVVDAPGLPREAVILREPRVPVAQWPYPGLVLPVEVAADDVRNVRILWRDYVPEQAGPPQEHEPPGEQAGEQGRSGAGGAEPVTVAGPDPDGIDFDLDGPPTVGAPAGVGTGPAGARGGRDPETTLRVPRPRPSPRPHPRVAPTADPTSRTHTDPTTRIAADPTTRIAAAGAEATAVRTVQGVGATLLVTDMERSIRFYQDLLGFRVVDRSTGSVVLASGGTRLVLRASQEMDPVRRRVVHLHLEVADLPAAHAALRAAGVRFTSDPRVVTRGSQVEQWAAAFRDPDGHGIALTEWRQV